MSSSAGFTAEELAVMREAGLVVFEGRLIHDAQPPITEDAVARIEAKCEGPIPEDLLALWRLSFGGALGYDFPVTIGDAVAPFSFTELFFPDSPHYNDLYEWIDAELEGLEDDTTEPEGLEDDTPEPEGLEDDDTELEPPWSGKLKLLPIGGFEYLDRVFVSTAPGDDHGSVWVWMRELPPAWHLRVSTGGPIRIAGSVRAMFAMMVLEEPPFAPLTEYPASEDLVEVLGELAARGEAGASAAAKARVLLEGLVPDWTEALESGTLAGRAGLARLAWMAVCRNDDLPLAKRLMDADCRPGDEVQGGGNALDQALAQGAMSVARHLLEHSTASTDNALFNGIAHVDAELTRELIHRGSRVDALTLLKVPPGRLDVAGLVLYQLVVRAPETLAEAAETAEHWAKSTATEERAAWLHELAGHIRRVIS